MEWVTSVQHNSDGYARKALEQIQMLMAMVVMQMPLLA